MTTKSTFFLALLFLIQLISSCCSQSITYDIWVDTVSIEMSEDSSTAVSKDFFSLLISFNSSFEEASNARALPGFNSAYANANPFNTCGNQYNALHTIIGYKLYVEDVPTGKIKLANVAFDISQKDVIEELMTRGPNNEENFLYNDKEFQLHHPEEIPQLPIFCA